MTVFVDVDVVHILISDRSTRAVRELTEFLTFNYMLHSVLQVTSR